MAAQNAMKKVCFKMRHSSGFQKQKKIVERWWLSPYNLPALVISVMLVSNTTDTVVVLDSLAKMVSSLWSICPPPVI